MIPKQLVEDILQRSDIKQIISPYVTLQRSGSMYKGLCPFHSEKSPSFMVYTKTNSFYCFGCGVGGSPLTFICQAENLDYQDGVRYLGNLCGIRVPDDEEPRTSSVKSIDKNRLYEMNKTAARFFYQCLRSSNPDSQSGFDYLTKTRGLSLSTIQHFGLGYAPSNGSPLTQYMLDHGYTLEELEIANLTKKSQQQGKYFDVFRGRVMFPIIDLVGNIIAFGGRLLAPSDTAPRYLNSSDTPVFNKRRQLFALNFAKDACKESIVLCEGYMDVIALHASGFTNAVATLGTSITPEHARLLKRYTKEVIISYDMDEAGRKAADKAMQLLEEVDLPVRLLQIQGAKDPDEYIRKFGREQFEQVLNGSASKFDYKLEQILSKYNIDEPQDRINALKELLSMISNFYSMAEREVYLEVVAKRMQMDVGVLRNDLNAIVFKKQKESRKKQSQTIIETTIGVSDLVNPDYVKMPQVGKAEDIVLGIILLKPEEFHPMLKSGNLDLKESDFLTTFNHRIFQNYCESTSGILDDSSFTPQEMGRITKLKINRMDQSDNTLENLLSYIEGLRAAILRYKSTSENATAEDLMRLIAEKRNQMNHE